MKRIKFPSILALSFIIVGLPLMTQAADTTEKPATPAATDAATKDKPVPYSGTVSAVDKEKKTFTFTEKKGDRVFVVTDKTKILNKTTKQPATFDDIAVGGLPDGFLCEGWRYSQCLFSALREHERREEVEDHCHAGAGRDGRSEAIRSGNPRPSC